MLPLVEWIYGWDDVAWSQLRNLRIVCRLRSSHFGRSDIRAAANILPRATRFVLHCVGRQVFPIMPRNPSEKLLSQLHIHWNLSKSPLSPILCQAPSSLVGLYQPLQLTCQGVPCLPDRRNACHPTPSRPICVHSWSHSLCFCLCYLAILKDCKPKLQLGVEQMLG